LCFEGLAVGLLTTIKQKAIGLGARVALNKRFGRYGTMPQLNLNLTDRHVEGEVVLKGEATPIRFAADYDLQLGPVVSGEGPGGADLPAAPVVTLTNIQLSREWMQRLAEDLVAGKPLAIPPELAVWMRRLGVM
jgi:hypothetical protein